MDSTNALVLGAVAGGTIFSGFASPGSGSCAGSGWPP